MGSSGPILLVDLESVPTFWPTYNKASGLCTIQYCRKSHFYHWFIKKYHGLGLELAFLCEQSLTPLVFWITESSKALKKIPLGNSSLTPWSIHILINILCAKKNLKLYTLIIILWFTMDQDFDKKGNGRGLNIKK